MFRVTIRSFLANKIRFALTTFGVILAVSFVVGAFVLGDGLRSSFTDVSEEITAGIDLEVRAAADANPVLVVGMSGNPFCRQARKSLAAAGVAFKYLGYGSYVGEWRRRNALKMWTGWPTFPMVFVKGRFVGGASDLDALIASGELKQLLAA